MPKARKVIVDSSLKCNKRIPWGSHICKELPSHWIPNRGWAHRRHVIPQHLLISAWNKQVEKHKPSTSDLQLFYSKMGGNRTCSSDAEYASEILRTMNDNLNNLFIDDGPLNSAIGFVSHKFDELAAWGEELLSQGVSLDDARKELIEEFAKIKGNPRWGQASAIEVANIVKAYEVLLKGETDVREVLNWMQDLADTAYLDLTTEPGMKKENETAINLFQAFDVAKSHQIAWSDWVNLVVRFVGAKLV